jgi:hypothetical protein
MRVRLILHPTISASWIIGKMANRLADNLKDLNIEVEIGEEPSASVDINHWMGWSVETKRLTKSTIMITHIDDPYKLQLIKSILESNIDVGICMSQQMKEWLVQKGIPSGKLAYALPAHDGLVKIKRIVIGLTTRIYSDGRKREDLLVKLSRSMRLDFFHFEIIGSGWELIIPQLENAGATVRYYPGTDDYKEDYRITLERIPIFDYYLYLGLDEGSMGTLDALAAGVKTIVTPQGFHLDTHHGITHPFWSFDELKEIFHSLSSEKQSLVSSVSTWTWLEYAKDHANLWHSLLDGEENLDHYMKVSDRYNQAGDITYSTNSSSWMGFYLKMAHPLRILSAVSNLPLLRPMRKLFGR